MNPNPRNGSPMSTTPEILEQQAAAVQERRDALAANLDAVEAKLEAERDALGNTVAQGGKTGKHRERLRELEEEAEGLRRALPILDREREALTQRLHDLRITSARDAYEQRASRARSAVMQVDVQLRSFLSGELAKLRQEMLAALEAEQTAASKYQAIAARSGQPATTGPEHSAWEAHRALPTLLKLLDQYASTGELHVGRAMAHR